MSDQPSLPVDAVALQTVVPRVLWMRWPVCLALSPTVVFPFGWALLVWLVLRLFAWLGDPARAAGRAFPGSLGVEGDTLVAECYRRTLRVPCAEVIEGWLSPQPSADETLIVLRLRGGRRLVARCTDLDGARALLRAAGVSVDQRVLEVPLGSLASASGHGPIMHLLGPVLLGIVVLTVSAGELAPSVSTLGRVAVVAAIVGFCAAAVAAFAHYIAPGRAIVGTDGVRVARLFSRRFVPYERLRALSMWRDAVRLETDDGDVSLDTRSFVSDAPGSREALAARLKEAIEIFRGERLAAVSLDLFARKGLPVAAWREEVRRVSQGGADYRSVVLESEEIARLAEDPATPAERRVGAVLSLAERPLDAALRERLRVAAGASANPRLRVALERALDGELEDDDLVGLEGDARGTLSAGPRRSRS